MQPALSLTSPGTSVSTPTMSLPSLEQAILQTLVYADLFDFPLTAAEIHRYLHGVTASSAAVADQLANGLPVDLWHQSPYYGLPGREAGAALRRQRADRAHQMWPAALRYGRSLAHFPFVRMVAVTGSLAVDNPNGQADIDYLIVTENGRLWLCRAFVILLVRLAARRGINLCPNYFLSRRALHFPDHNLYTAHELTQMVPLSGMAIYEQMRQQNNWTATYLPNAAGPPAKTAVMPVMSGRATGRLFEISLQGRLGQRLERWEMSRKIEKFGRQATGDSRETTFTSDWCKGHFEGHARRTLLTYQARLSQWQGMSRKTT